VVLFALPRRIRPGVGEASAGRENEDEVTVFKSYGIGVEDLATAELVVERAREHGMGVELDLRPSGPGSARKTSFLGPPARPPGGTLGRAPSAAADSRTEENGSV